MKMNNQIYEIVKNTISTFELTNKKFMFDHCKLANKKAKNSPCDWVGFQILTIMEGETFFKLCYSNGLNDNHISTGIRKALSELEFDKKYNLILK